MRTPTDYKHIETDEKGRLFVSGTRFKVLLLLPDHTVSGWDAVQMQRQHPGLTLAQAHAVLEYYYDNQQELDRLLDQRRQAELSELRNTSVASRIARLEEMKQRLTHQLDELRAAETKREIA